MNQAARKSPSPPTTLGRSIIEFLSDGSLAALAEELSTMLGARIELRDERDRLIVYDHEHQTWQMVPDAPMPPPDARHEAIVVSERAIGSLVVHDGDEDTHRIVAWLAQVASEFCQVELGLRHRVREMELMYRLSALLIRAADPDLVLETALELVLDILGLDAGSIVLFNEDSPAKIVGDERSITTKASRGLSEEWLHNPLPLSKDRVFDRLAASGEVVAIEDLASDPRVLRPDLLRREGLASFISAGLSFRGRPIGVFRLYSRTPRAFTSDDKHLLRAVAEHSAIAIEQARLLRIQEEEERVRRQLQLAEDVQRRMLPNALPPVEGLSLHARYEPTERLAGDFYDAFETPEGLVLAVGDVVGHGVAAALLMASVRATLRASADESRSVAEIVARVNDAMVRDTLPSEFCSLFVARIEGTTLRYCGAGHDPPLLLRADGTSQRLEPGGMLAGIIDDAEFHESTIELREGDALVLFTDGLVEAMDFQGRQFGTDRLEHAVRRAMQEPGVDAETIEQSIFWELRQFAGLRERSDDLTVLIALVRDPTRLSARRPRSRS